jgi:diguanylate cyclase (GGDEF)-like protein
MIGNNFLTTQYPLIGELSGKIVTNGKVVNSLSVSPIVDGFDKLNIDNFIEGEKKPIEEILILKEEVKNALLNLSGRIASGEIPSANLGLHLLNNPEQKMVEAVGVNTNRNEDGSPIAGDSLTILIHDAEAMSKDALTSAYKREILYKKIESILEKGVDFSVLMIDLNKFKSINDEYGHEAGDQALISLTNILEHTLRKGHGKLEDNSEERFADSVVSRFGGDEFVVLLPNCDADNIPIVEERILNSVNQHNVMQNGSNSPEISLSMSGASINELNENEKSINGLLDLADKRMFEKKMGFRVSSVKEFVKDFLGTEVGQKIDLLKDVLMGIDFSKFTKIQASQMVTIEINEFLKSLANEKIAIASKNNDEELLKSSIEIRTGIPGFLGLRDEIQKKSNLQIEMDKMIWTFHKIQGEIPIQNLNPKERLEQLRITASVLSEHQMSVEFIASLIRELNNLSLKEV